MSDQKKKPEVLDLLGGTKKKRQVPSAGNNRQAQAPATAGSKPAATPRKAADPAPKQVAARNAAAPKKAALDLLNPQRKKAAPAPKPTPTPAPPPEPKEAPAPAPAPVATEPAGDKIINVKPPVSVAELAAAMGLKPFKLIAELMPMGVFANPATSLDSDQVAALCEKHGYAFERVKREKGAGVKAPVEVVKEPEPVAVEEEPEDALKVRTPIITVMGHVDHGKTSLLDYIRRTKVVAGEAGGITQHIGAYSVDHGGNILTFIDTPGHAIFTEMRARGADVTDIVVLVVAANDGIMPQTREAITHAKAAGKTIIVAVNKCDLPAADPVRVRTQLMEEGLMPTDFGGDIECVDVSAHTGDGIDNLLDLLCLQAEVLELKANPRANCRASIIEARMEQGKGSSATVIVQSGTLKVGMPFICGPYAGKIKTLFNDQGKAIKKVTPGMPAEVSGFLQTPNVGDELVEMKNEREARRLAEERQEELRQQRLSAPRRSRMEDILAMMGDGSQKAVLKLYLKGDVKGSV